MRICSIWPFVGLAVANALAIPVAYFVLHDIDQEQKAVFELPVLVAAASSDPGADEEKR